MKSGARNSLRLDRKRVADLISQLDAAGKWTTKVSARRSQRYDYRGYAIVEIVQPGREPESEAVPCRNISRDGASFLSGRFVHIGTPCRMRLVSAFNHAHVIEARVVRCRYIPGTAGVHEVGVNFATPIDVAMFHAEATSIRVLIVDDDAARSAILSAMLKCHAAECATAASAADAITMALASPFDLILANFDSQKLDACGLVRKLREQGYVRTIASVSTLGADRMSAHCTEAGCSDCKAIHLTEAGLVQLMTSLRAEPIVSTLPANPDSARVVNQFVFAMQEWVAALESACGSKDFATAREIIGRVEFFARGAGFEPIADAAAEFSAKLGDNATMDRDRREQLNQFVRLALSARPCAAVDPEAPSPPG